MKDCFMQREKGGPRFEDMRSVTYRNRGDRKENRESETRHLISIAYVSCIALEKERLKKGQEEGNDDKKDGVDDRRI